MTVLIDKGKSSRPVATGPIVRSGEIPHLTVDEMAAQAFVFFIGGFETSSTTISYTLYELAMNLILQAKLQAEIDFMLDKHGGEITYEAVQGMEYLDKVVNVQGDSAPPSASLVSVGSIFSGQPLSKECDHRAADSVSRPPKATWHIGRGLLNVAGSDVLSNCPLWDQLFDFPPARSLTFRRRVHRDSNLDILSTTNVCLPARTFSEPHKTLRKSVKHTDFTRRNQTDRLNGAS
uniref:Cytochrome P450 n=1 Tax=Timema shepardi TaxID=629360 RepID=A0A7R9ANK7_TIMSH|nr:unnamed protein product [Timema shepardi]